MTKENGFSLSQSERDALMEQIYGGYVRNPATVEGNKATQGQRAPHRNAGQIDYGAYSGEASDDFMDQKYESYRNSKYYDPDRKTGFEKDGYDHRWRNRDTWGKVAAHLGIDKVDDEGDLRRMYDFVKGQSMQKDEDTVQEPSETPTFTPSDAHQDARSEYESTRDNPIPRMSDQIGANAMADAIRHGDDLNDWYQRDTKARVADAKLGAYEMGERTKFLANQFVGKVPELGDVGKLYESYADKLKDMG